MVEAVIAEVEVRVVEAVTAEVEVRIVAGAPAVGEARIAAVEEEAPTEVGEVVGLTAVAVVLTKQFLNRKARADYPCGLFSFRWKISRSVFFSN
jgi:hypothetical protein